MCYTIKINHENRVVINTHSGSITKKEIGDVWCKILTFREFSNNGYNLISDYRDGSFDFSINDLEVIDNFLFSIKNIIKGKRNAILVSKPHETAISVYFEVEKSIELDFKVKTFSTVEAAMEFII